MSAQDGNPRRGPIRVLVIGGGFGGMYCARRLERKLAAGTAEIVLVNPENYLLFTPLLPEAASGTVEPRHVVVPLRRVLKRTRLLVGDVVDVNLKERTATVQVPEIGERMISWDRLVLAPGSISRMLPIPGLAEYAFEFKNLVDGITLRNRVLRQLELAEATEDADERRARLTFVVVGAGYAGTELIAELQVMVRKVLRDYPGLHPRDVRWLLADAAPQVLPELGAHLGQAALDVLRRRGIEVRLATTVEEVGPGWVRLSDGETVRTATFVWTAGVRPDPLIERIAGLETSDRGRVRTDAYTRVAGRGDVFAIGDAAGVPEGGSGGKTSPPTAQHALRQSRVCADNVAASLGDGEWREFDFKGLGLLVNLAGYAGVGRVLNIPVSGFVGWIVTRTYHLLQLPTWNRRLRVVLDWTVAVFFPSDIAELGSLRRQRL